MSDIRLFLVFGEDPSDRAALSHLLRALSPVGSKPTVKNLRQPIILSRIAKAGKRRKIAEEIAAFSKGHEKDGCKVFAIAHRDCDAVEPKHIADASRIECELKAAGVANPIAAVPAWEIEAWWMLFPAALQSVRSCWNSIDYGHQDVGAIINAKERLIHDLRPIDKNLRNKCPEYKEADGIRISEFIFQNPEHINLVKAQNDSFNEFRKKVLRAFL